MTYEPRSNNRLVLSYLTLRKVLGGLGMLLPLVLLVGGKLLYGLEIQETVSDYYHTGMRDIFVGVLCAMGVFLYSYKGYSRKDNWAGTLASVLVIGTALFPTTPVDPTPLTAALGKVHIACAVGYFSTLAYFSIALFTKSAPNRPLTPRKRQRNSVYRACGWVMLAAITSSAIYFLLPEGLTAPIDAAIDPVFCLESLAIFAFGVSWFVKGEGILEDEK